MRHFRLTILFFFLSGLISAHAQLVMPDTIVSFLSQSPKDDLYIVRLNKIAFNSLRSSPELGRELATQSMTFSKVIQFDEGYARAVDIMGSSYWVVGDYETAMKYYQLSAKESMLINDSASVSSVYHNMGEVYKKMGQYDKGIELLTTSIKWDVRNKHTAISTYNIGEAYLFKNELDNPGMYEATLLG